MGKYKKHKGGRYIDNFHIDQMSASQFMVLPGADSGIFHRRLSGFGSIFVV